MRTKTVKRHYCDFCNKGGMVGKLIAQHEITCLRNPTRTCFMCEQPVDMPKLIHELMTGSGVEMANLRGAAGGCPACILAAILQAKHHPQWRAELSNPENEIRGECDSFDYKKEKEDWYAEKHREMAF